MRYSCQTINDWVAQKKLPAIDYFGKTIIAKEHLIQFISKNVNLDRVDKSITHLSLIEKYLQYQELTVGLLVIGQSY